METEFLVESFGSNLVSLVKVNDLPSLVDCITVSISNTNFLAFFIFRSCNIKNLVVCRINELLSLELEYLEPS